MFYRQETENLFMTFNEKFGSSRLNLSDLDMSLAVAVPRIDYYLSYRSLILNKKYDELLDEYFKDGLLKLLKIYYKQGRLNRYGNVTDVVSYISCFDKIGVKYYWIPKNACTHYKKVLMLAEQPEFNEKISDGNFHEDVNKEFGISMPKYINYTNGSKKEQERYFSFAIYRDPIERFVSCYIDKFVKPIAEKRNLEPFIENIINNFYFKIDIKDIPKERSLSFNEFLLMVLNTPAYALNEHWRPQSDFLQNLDLDVFVEQGNAETLMVERGFIKETEVGKKANSSVGKQYTKGLYKGGFEDLLPKEIDLNEILDYSQFISNYAENALKKFYGNDYTLIKKWSKKC